MLGAALVAAAFAPPSAAQADVVTQRTYAVPAGALDDALNQFARQAGITLSFDPSLVAGKTSQGLSGSHAVEAALDLLLAPNGLVAALGDNSAFTVRARPPQGAAQLLPAVKVQAQVPNEGSEAQGYRRETVSQVGPWQGRELQDTPYSMTVISRDLIENLQATTPDQIYRIAPTMQFVRPQFEYDQAQAYLRGFRVFRPSYRDGLPNDGYGHDATTEDVESVEIFTGLSGFLYGPGNVGGMINHVSKRPTRERLSRMTVGGNGGSNYYAQADLGGPIDAAGRFGYRVNGIWQTGDSVIDNQEIRKRFLSGAFDWHLSDSLLLQVDAAYRHYEVDGVQANWFLAPGVSRPSPGRLDSSVSWGQPWGHSFYTSQRYGTQLRWDASEALTVRAGWRHNRTQPKWSGVYNTITSDGTITQTVFSHYAQRDNSRSRSRDSDTGSHSVQLFADLRFNTGGVAHKLTTGVQYNESWEKYFSGYAPAVVFTGLPLDRPSYQARPEVAPVDRGARQKPGDITYSSLLIGDDITFNERWSLLAGVARSTIDVDSASPFGSFAAGYDKSAVTPNVSLLYKPLPALTLYTTYLESLERGGIAGQEFGNLTVSNRGEVMKPLISDQIEIGAKWSLGGMLLTAALFEIDKSLEYYDLSDPDDVRYVQDGRQVHRGIEFTGIGKAARDLTLTGGLTLLDAEIKEQKQNPEQEGNRPDSVAKTSAKLRAEYRVPSWQALSLNSTVSYTGSRYADVANTDRLSSYTLLDAGARYQTQIARRPLTLRVDVLNLADKDYWSWGTSLGTPRTVLFSLSTEL